MWGIYVYMYTKNEVSVSNPVPEGGVHRQTTLTPMPMMTMSMMTDNS